VTTTVHDTVSAENLQWGCERCEDCPYCNPKHGKAPNRLPWRYWRGQWSGRWPSLGGDEWCRRTLVIPIPLLGAFVFPLWTCREGCEHCVR